jgi:uncharacterized membrane protein
VADSGARQGGGQCGAITVRCSSSVQKCDERLYGVNVKPSTGLAVLFGVVGTMHFLKPDLFDSIVPRALPGPARAYTVASALVEFTLAVGLARRSTRRMAGYGAAAFFVAVFPANVQMALDGGMLGKTGLLASGTLAWARLPFQVPLVWLAWQVGRGSRA